MIEMLYKAFNAEGALIKGLVHGENEQEIFLTLRKRGLNIVELAPAGFSIELVQDRLKKLMNGVREEELIVFTRQFQTLFKAGLGIDALLSTLAKQTQNEILKEALINIRDDIQSGLSLAKAFAKHPQIFDKLYVSMLLAGEEAGILDQVLEELSMVLEKDNKLKHDVASATLYPKIIIGVMAIAFYVMMTFVIPKFSDFFGKFNAQLPLPTRILIAVSEFCSNYWYVVLVIIAVLGFLFGRYAASEKGKLQIDYFKLRMPVFGPLFQKIAMARFGHLFAALYKSGLPLVRSFEVLSQVIGNEAYALEINQFREGLLEGKTISEVMRTGKAFAPIMVETTAIGEQSGNLDTMLSAMAGHFDMEINHMTKNMTTLIEPILLCLMFGMVTLMALGIFLPMWNMSKAVTNH